MATELTGKEIRDMVISDRRYSFLAFEQFNVVIHSGEDCCPIEIMNISLKIGKRFEAMYGDSVNSELNLEHFDPFSQELNKILSIKAPRKELKSSEVLDNFFGLTKGKVNIKRVLEKL